MTKKMLIDATHAEETRVVVLDGNKVDEFDFESLNKKQLAGNIYLAKVTRVEPSLQAAFVDYGGNRHGFLAFSEIHPDYYQIPKADRDALLAEEAALAREADDEEERPASETKPSRSRSRSRKRSQPATDGAATSDDDVRTSEPVTESGSEDPGTFETGRETENEADGSTGLDAEPASTEEASEGPEDSSTDHAPESPSFSGEAEAPAEAEEHRDLRPDEAPDGPEPEESTLVETPEDKADRKRSSATELEAVGGQESAREEQPQRRARPRRYKIQEVIKVRQILLVQVIKEERGNKGAALTTYLSLAGRYCVLMPNTARGGGISRKITNATDRKKLKEISNSISVPDGAGLIIRTAGANRTKTEIRRDYEYLLRQWEQIRDLTLKSVAPCLIYEEGSLVKRVIRDLYSRDIDEVLVDGERGYREAKDYMKMLMPSHAKNVKHYSDPLPLFSRFQVESYLTGMFNPVVQLKSGGYIVIDVTEALVAVDVNSGRATREASIEDTALKTNLEAAEEAARQMRLRDLAGLIVIDFIDMDERKNNSAVEKRLKEKLKSDRARIQVGRISAFGLLEMSRQRLRPGMIEATTKGCPHCHGTGRVRSDDSVALALLREVEEEGVRQRSKEVLVVAPVEIANYLLNHKREHVALIEKRFGLSVRIEGDPSLINPDYRIERFKSASRIVPTPEGLAPIKIEIEDSSETEEIEEEKVAVPESSGETAEEKTPSKKKRRRRRRGGAKTSRDNGDEQTATSTEKSGADTDDETMSEVPKTEAPREARSEETQMTPSSERGGGASDVSTEPNDAFGDVIDLEGETAPEIVAVPETENPQKQTRRARVSQPAAAVIAEVAAPLSGDGSDDSETEDLPESAQSGESVQREPATRPGPSEAFPQDVPEGSEQLPRQPEEFVASEQDEPAFAGSEEMEAEPKRRGWWSRAGGAG